ncbi:hypothetical protein GGR51DRAFT_562782 [Nemania sp. FL0031]|nr:hypothetical protein GGR51DRAFT_562782 [Nemania sp. FL0031]
MGNRVKLQVGERKFSTTKDTLMREGSYFSALLSSGWKDQRDDDYHFIDSDPELFADILRYLRFGNYPLFFNPTTGTYDYAKYSALLSEVQYFGIEKLEDWIRNQRYLEAVKTRYSLDVLGPDEAASLKRYSDTTIGAERWEFSYLQQGQKRYVCPRKVPEHYDNPGSCGRKCRSFRGDSGVEYEEAHVITTIVTKTQHVFNPAICLGVEAEVDQTTQ